MVVLVVWPVLAIAALTLSLDTLRSTRPGHAQGELVALAVVGVAAALALPASGNVAAGGSRAVGRFAAVVAYVWSLAMVVYSAATLASDPPGDTDTDTTVGAGIVILGIPVLLAIAMLAALGVAVRWCCHRIHRRRLIPTGA